MCQGIQPKKAGRGRILHASLPAVSPRFPGVTKHVRHRVNPGLTRTVMSPEFGRSRVENCQRNQAKIPPLYRAFICGRASVDTRQYEYSPREYRPAFQKKRSEKRLKEVFCALDTDLIVSL
jgi:hypothetical protein